ncbi:MAG: TonB-dependent receptor [Betaproteobacteria bacterium]|nr:TonB-dependent receptor [Betaproteobacteria bacterium]
MPTSGRSGLASWLGRLGCLCLFARVWAQAPPLTAWPVETSAPAPAYRQYDKVEITGSSIVRKEQTQALPVMVFTREDIRRTGLASMTEVLQALPSMGNFVESSQLAMLTGGYSNAALHGLPTGTLVLVNGLRMAPFGRPTIVGPERSGVDLQTLPLVDVERIEVLSDGASSLYGTDAIAGVVNIILRSSRKDVEIRADRFSPAGGRGQGWSSSLSWGHGLLPRDGHSLMLTLEVSDRRELLGAARPYASQGWYTFEHQGQRYGTGGFLLDYPSSPPTLEERDATGAPVRRVSAAYPDGQCTGRFIAFANTPGCLYNPYPSLGIYPAEQQVRLHAHAEVQLDHGFIAFGEYLQGRSRNDLASALWPSHTSDYGLAPGTEAHAQALQSGLDPAHTRLLWQPDLPALRQLGQQSARRIRLGLRGESAGWDHSGQLYWADHHALMFSQNAASLSYNTVGLTNNADVLHPLDSHNPLTHSLLSLQNTTLKDQGTQTLSGLQWRASRTLAQWQEQDVLMGLGLDWRTEHSDYQNPTLGANQTGPPSFRARRHIRAAFGELQLPLAPSWQALLGLRTDRYQDVGVTSNVKMATRWVITPEWSMRAAVGSGFRSPSVAQTHRAQAPFFWATTERLFECNAAQQAIASALKTATGESGLCDRTSNILSFGNGNPELKPERSTQISWGLAFVAQGHLRIAADVWAVRIRDALEMPGIGALLDAPNQHQSHYILVPPGFAQANHIDPRRLVLLRNLHNLGSREKAGVDLEGHWRQPSDCGLWHLQAQVSHTWRSRAQAAPGEAHTSDLGRYDSTTRSVTPRWRAQIVGSLSRPGWRGALIAHHTGGYQDAPIGALNLDTGAYESVLRRVSSFTTWDVQLHTQITSHTDVRLGIRNLFARQAPLSFASNSRQLVGANTTYSTLWGRVIDLGLVTRF